MVKMRLSTCHAGLRRNGPCFYQIATQTIACDRALPIDWGFAVRGPEIPSLQWCVADNPNEGQGKTVFDRSGWIGGAWRHVRAVATEGGYHIWIEGIGTYDVLENGSFIRFRDPLTELSANVIEALFGPAMMLTLALNEVWSLHASAASFGGKTFAFMGESGAGKSTLARYLNMQPGWQRVADDILPVKENEGTVAALPRFPQFKLPQDKQPGVALSAQIPLHGIYVLGKPQNQPSSRLSAGVQIRPLAGERAMSSLIRHTVAVRLFGRGLLARHLSFSQHSASRVPISLLNFPRGHKWLEPTRETLERHCLSI